VGAIEVGFGIRSGALRPPGFRWIKPRLGLTDHGVEPRDLSGENASSQGTQPVVATPWIIVSGASVSLRAHFYAAGYSGNSPGIKVISWERRNYAVDESEAIEIFE
jgi:hypothetical protein